MFLTTLALTIAMQTAAPATPAPNPGADIGAKSTAFSTCIRSNIAKVPATVTPEAGADQVLATCKADETALRAAIDVQLAAVPAESQATARQQVDASFAQARTGIANGIRQSRTPAATPTTPATPPAK
ncbi:hypothetical protein [Sphingomonas sp. RS2018]